MHGSVCSYRTRAQQAVAVRRERKKESTFHTYTDTVYSTLRKGREKKNKESSKGKAGGNVFSAGSMKNITDFIVSLRDGLEALCHHWETKRIH